MAPRSGNRRALHENTGCVQHVMLSFGLRQGFGLSTVISRLSSHQYLCYEACLKSCTSLVPQSSLSGTSYQLYCCKISLRVAFHLQSLQISLPLLLCSSPWLYAIWSRIKVRSLAPSKVLNHSYSYFLARYPEKISWSGN